MNTIRQNRKIGMELLTQNIAVKKQKNKTEIN